MGFVDTSGLLYHSVEKKGKVKGGEGKSMKMLQFSEAYLGALIVAIWVTVKREVRREERKKPGNGAQLLCHFFSSSRIS